ncbi:transmembrane protein 192 isoform X2 [Brachyhypopomus gauderio]|uniref:transmembrane protein 192 isoform X2 n=1 Tax=Brachyhypopomus gauderio TaxID=698409 RepID=UPI004042C8D9
MDPKRLSANVSNRNTDFTQSIEDDPLIDGPLISKDALESSIKREFQKLPTAWTAGLLIAVHVVLASLSVAAVVACVLVGGHGAECAAALSGLDPVSPVLLAKAALWLLVFLFERCVLHHHSAARRRGYLRFYRLTREIQHMPLLIHSAGNAAVLLVVAPSSFLDRRVKNLSVYFLVVIMCAELFACVACLIKYTVCVVQFNKQSLSPDVSEEERSRSFSPGASITRTETGFRDGSSLEEVVEKQADLIEYLKQHNTQLSKRLLILSAQQTQT